MPLVLHKCPECGAALEVAADAASVRCAHCGVADAPVVVSAIGAMVMTGARPGGPRGAHRFTTGN